MNTDFFSGIGKYNPDEEGYISDYLEQGINEISASIFPGGDVTRFKEIIDLNPSLDIFNNLSGQKIKIPDSEELLKFAQPVLNEANAIISGAENIVQQLDNIPILKGYSKEALNALESAKSIIGSSPKLLVDAIDRYEGELPKLIPWLLSGKQ